MNFCSHFFLYVVMVELYTEVAVSTHELIDSQMLVRLVTCCGAGCGDSPALLPAQPEPITAMAIRAALPIVAAVRRARSPEWFMTK